MSNTFTQQHIHAVFAVKHRQALIAPKWKEDLHKYITGIVQNYGNKMLSINSMPDHLHLFFGQNPNQSTSDLMRIVKSNSSKWINEQRLTNNVFRWQEGYASFSYARSQVRVVCAYIRDQEKVHKKTSFIDELEAFLKKFEVDYDPKYLFKPPE